MRHTSGLPVFDPTAVTPNDLLFYVVDLVRTGRANTRSGIQDLTGFGRSIIDQRIQQAQDLGLITSDNLAESTGGRQSKLLEFKHDIGAFAQLHLNPDWVRLTVSNLAGERRRTIEIDWTVSQPLSALASKVSQSLNAIVSEESFGQVWALGIVGRTSEYLSLADELSAIMLVPAVMCTELQALTLGASRAAHDAGNDYFALGARTSGSQIAETAIVRNGQILRGADGLLGQSKVLELFGVAQLVSVLNPSRVIVAASNIDEAAETLSQLRTCIYGNCSPEVTRNLDIEVVSNTPEQAELGMLTELQSTIFSRAYLNHFLSNQRA